MAKQDSSAAGQPTINVGELSFLRGDHGQSMGPVETTPIPAGPDRVTTTDSTLVFSFEAALRLCLNDRKLFEDIVECLFKEVESLLNQAHQALDRADADTMGRAAHRLKGTVSHLGAPAAMEALRAVERMGFAGDLSCAAAAMSELDAQMEQLEQALAAYRRQS